MKQEFLAIADIQLSDDGQEQRGLEILRFAIPDIFQDPRRLIQVSRLSRLVYVF